MNVVHLSQGSEEWESWRHNGVGASDLAAILGISPFDDATRANLLEEKVTRLRRPINFAMRRGTRMEPIARDAYLAAKDYANASPVCIQHQGSAWAKASLDLLCTNSSGVQWIAELKCPNKDRHMEALAGFVPYYYQAQCQWQMWCAGLPNFEYVSYSELAFFGERRLAIVPVKQDCELISRLVDRAAEFWMEVIDERERRGLEAA